MTTLPSRREFLLRSARGVGASVLLGAPSVLANDPSFTIRTVTRGPRHHFFGYYGVCPWNLSGQKLACLESPFQDHMPLPNESARVGLVDQKTGEFTPVGSTLAWNLQQGAMLHWNPLAPEDEVIHNDRASDTEVVAAVLDMGSGKRRLLPRAVSAVPRTGRFALSLTYGRLTRLRSVVGYPGTVDPHPDLAAPENDGVFRMDLETGVSTLLVSIARVHEVLVRQHPHLRHRHMWFNHTVWNPSATRFFFLASPTSAVGEFLNDFRGGFLT